jgi:predicted peroxiredoxin
VTVQPGESPPGVHWVLLLQRGSEDVLYEAAAMTAAAVSLGLDVTLVWFDHALAALAAGRLDGGEESGEPALPGTFGAAGRLLREAREAGRVRFLACSASAIAGSGGIEGVRQRVDDVVGWPTAIALIRSAEHAFVW